MNNEPAPAISGSREEGAFTLQEMLVAMTILLMLMGILFSMISQSGAVWQRTQNEVDSNQSARFAFNLITRTLSQSRMGVYNDYDDPGHPTAYLRKSDLHFVIDAPPGTDFGQGNAVFFQAPLGKTLDAENYEGLPGMLNSVGYYLTYGKDPNLPEFLQPYDHHRFRLMQYLAPAENMTVYSSAGKEWFKDYLSSYSTVIADNVILLLFWPRLSKEEDPDGGSLTDDYLYDSRAGATMAPQPVTANQQPPLVQVTLVAIDKAAANRLPDTPAPPAAITEKLQGLFLTSSADPKSIEEQYEKDLAELERRLSGAHIGYQVFNSMVTLRETKWSK